MPLAFVVLLLAAGPAPRPQPVTAPAYALLATIQVDKKGAAEICLSGSKPLGAKLLLRVEAWRGQRRLGFVDVPDQDSRGVFAQCRSLGLAAIKGDTLKVLAVAGRPTALKATPRPDGGD